MPTPSLKCFWSEEKLHFSMLPRTTGMPLLFRAASPSAENQGERDILGVRHGGVDGPYDYSNVSVQGWEIMGNYAIRFDFSDGHRSGLYAYDYLRALARHP
jgi:DUF971 family protein